MEYDFTGAHFVPIEVTVVVNLHSAVSPAGGWRDQCLIDLAPLGSDVVKLRPWLRTQVSKTDPWTKTSSPPSNGRRKFKTFIS